MAVRQVDDQYSGASSRTSWGSHSHFLVIFAKSRQCRLLWGSPVWIAALRLVSGEGCLQFLPELHRKSKIQAFSVEREPSLRLQRVAGEADGGFEPDADWLSRRC
jgi:hypothetical protein